MAVEVRLVKPEEYAAVAELTVGVYVGDGYIGADWAYVAELRDTAIRAAQADVLVAVGEDGMLLGSVTSCPPGSPYREAAGPGEGEFRMLSVAATARGGGVGRALVAACLERSQAAGDHAMVLSTMSGMADAHRLYERLGFRRTPEADWYPESSVQLQVYRLDY